MPCLVSDGNPTYRYFAQDAGISHDAMNLSAGLRVNGAVHIQNVNAYTGASNNGSIAFMAWPLITWTTTWAGIAHWTITTPTHGRALWPWPWADFHI